MSAAAYDIQGLTALRAAAGRAPKAQLPAVAKQFESLFARMLIKSMREATPDSGLWSGPGMSMYRDLLDQQWSQAISKQGGLGIADVLVRQLGGAQATPAVAPAVSAVRPAADHKADADSFVGKLWPVLQRHADATGVRPESVLAQAALETGWGAHVPRRPDGSSSHNLFGIKAGANWHGDKVAHTTVEYADGAYVRRTEWFRAYPSVDAGVADYMALVGTPRYREALAGADGPRAYGEALQAAGYATDPEYAQKIGRVAGSETFRRAVAELKNGAKAPINL